MATPPKKPTDGTAKPPAPRKPATPRKTTTRKTAASPTAKPATADIGAAASMPTPTRTARKPAAPRKPATKRATVTRKTAGTGTGRRWGIAAAVTAAGAAITAGLLALRGSTPVKEDPAKPNEGQTAHQADGTDSSKSFEAGIADEGTIPE